MTRPVSPKMPGALLHERILDWYAREARSLPWREPGTSPWGVLVSEVMLQQTPVARVEPAWRQWMSRWPVPADLAASAPGDAIHAWGRLGYPRRALRLHAAAVAMVERHHGGVPDTATALLALPGVGTYTAAAVSAFAFGGRTAVVDTNVRRVLARAVNGAGQAAPSLTRAEMDLAGALLPEAADDARTWSVAVMELGALVCLARSPRCEACPVRDLCAWQQASRPAYEGPARRSQSWHGTDRQCRGVILAVLRATHDPVTTSEVDAAWSSDHAQRERCLDSLVADGLVEPLAGNRYRLPGR
ncbi:MAG TPA: A/G-specific adenine glycosylase [Dermatophilaceae bacterium]